MKLTGIDAGRDRSLIFRFDDNGIQREWVFEPASLAEFLALLLDGGLRDGDKLMLPPAAMTLAGQPGRPAQLNMALPKLEMALPLTDAQLKSLRDAIDRRLAAGNTPQQASPTGGGPRQMAAAITASPRRRKASLN